MSWEKKKKVEGYSGGRNRRTWRRAGVRGAERERGERERGREKACVYSLRSTQLPISPEFRSLDGKLPCDQEGRSKPPDSLWLLSIRISIRSSSSSSRVRMESTFGWSAATTTGHGESQRSHGGIHHSHLWLASPAPAAAEQAVSVRVRQRDGRGEGVHAAAAERHLRHPPFQPDEVFTFSFCIWPLTCNPFQDGSKISFYYHIIIFNIRVKVVTLTFT